MRRLVCAFVVRKTPKASFLASNPNYGVVMIDVPMEYTTSGYLQIPFADQGYDKEVCVFFN